MATTSVLDSGARQRAATPLAVVEAELRRALGSDELAAGVPLASLSRWRIGGPADLVATPGSAEALADVLRIVRRAGVPVVVVGHGSNLLFDDAGLRGVVVRLGRALGGFRFGEHGEVEAGAGLWVPSFVRRVIGRGLAGAVHAVGIPGTLGGLVVMNGGSQRRGIGEHVESVDLLDRDGERRRLDRDTLAFSYRRSALQRGNAVLVSVRLRFPPGDPHAMRREAIALLRARRAKFPRVRANCGSVFVSDPALYDLIGPPGLAIERAGLKGFAIGGAQFSPDHANFIVNNGMAGSADVLRLIALARARVRDLTGVAMVAEVRHVSPDGRIRAADEAAAEFAPSPESAR